jgi:hypothetical protein
MSERYSLDAAIEHLLRIKQMGGSREWHLVVRKTNPGGLTAHQTTEVKAIYAGFDWEAGKVVIEPARPLTELSPEQVEAIQKSVRAGGSWHAYEREKKLRARIAELEAKLKKEGE